MPGTVRNFLFVPIFVLLAAGSPVFAQEGASADAKEEIRLDAKLGSPFSQEDAGTGLRTGGYLRSQIGSFFSNGRHFTEETALSLTLDYSAPMGSLHVNPTLYERGGVMSPPGIREAYIDISTRMVDFRIGKQLVIWGKADGAFILDQVSPKDLSQFLTPEFEELRLGVTGIRTDLYLDSVRLQAVWLPWFTPAILPAPGSLWYKTAVSPVPVTSLPPVLPAHELASGDYFGKLSWSMDRLDLELAGGYMWDDMPVARVVSRTGPPSPGLTIQPEYYRTIMAGGNASLSAGPFILRGEAAYMHGRRFQADPTLVPEGYIERGNLQYLLGTDFSLAGITMNLQFMQDLVIDPADSLQRLPVKTTFITGLAATMFRESLKAEVMAYMGLETQDFLFKPGLTWDVSDGIELSGGAMIFLGDTGDFGRYRDNSGAFLKLKMSF